MTQFVFDIETTSVESTAIVLSAAIVYFDPEKDLEVTYETLVDRTLYVKFDALAQKSIGRSVSKDTMEWWAKQPKQVRDLCLLPSRKDLSPAHGIGALNSYVKTHGDAKSFVWARGSMDQTVIESLARAIDLKPMAHFSNWCDVRTGIRLLKDTSDWNGYCEVRDLDMTKVDKHNPIADVVYDALMLIRGI